ncbi:hypothetical protein G7046_g8162 [Stylonectria norvegica]|nr:hypothetical protein G7046_g8162 [Stylonectria norvegica]
MPPRKKPRPNPAEASTPTAPATALTAVTSTSQAPTQAPSTAAPSASQQQMPSSQPTNGNGTTLAGKDTTRGVRKTKSWYGSWPRTPNKASASTSVAKENIFGGTVKTNKTPDLARFDSRRGADTASIYSTTETLSGLPKIPENKSAETIKQGDAGAKEDMNVTSDTTTKGNGESDEAQKPTDETPTSDVPGSHEDSITPTAETPAVTVTEQSAAGWLGWWSKTNLTETQASSIPGASLTPADAPKEDVREEVEPSRPATPPPQNETPETPSTKSPETAPPSTSWLEYWYPSGAPASKSNDKPEPPANSEANSTAAQDVAMAETPPPPPPHKHEPAPKAGSTWAFWAKDSPKTTGATVEPESGQIAVMGDSSEAHPKPMTECDVSPVKANNSKGETKAKTLQTGGKSTWRRNKRVRPQSMDLDAHSRSGSGASTPTNSIRQSQEAAQPDSPAKVDAPNQSTTESEVPAKPSTNLLLPSFSSTYHPKETPSLLKQVTQFLLRTEQAPTKHVFRLKDPPRIHKAIALGVHGLFPATYLRAMIGQPTGTSLRFASLCADAIRRWADAHGCGDCEIEKVALEGEGKINDRVDNLWKLMLNWIEHIRSADLVLIACHSQGVPVSVMLLEKLIDLGIITNAKIGVCAMAGVSLGPFPEYKSGLLGAAATELWDFGNPESTNTKRFEVALRRVLDYGARITFIGSIDDQLVPMESAVYSPANHPYIFRAVFIDGRVHAPDFIAHLVGFALKLRNLGVPDHGLIRELSIPLAGSLYSGEGHSRLYFDSAVYDLAVSHVLETTPAVNPAPADITRRELPTAPNPYVLPWIMRGLLEEDFVRNELSGEVEELLRQFDDWKPANKALKDVKYRLEAVRSKL